MSNLQIVGEFEVLDSNPFTIYGDILNPLFYAKDVAERIDHSNVSAMLSKVDSNEKIKCILPLTNNYTQTRGGIRENTEVWFLTERGLYEVLMQSRKPIAQQFKSKIKDLLEGLRKNEIKLIKGDDNMNNELMNVDIKNMLQSVTESNNSVAACMQQMTNMMAMMMNIMSNNFQSNINTNTEQEMNNNDYIKTLIKPVVRKNYNMTKISSFISSELNISCNAAKLNSYLVDKEVLYRVTGFEHNGNIYDNFYIFSEDYRDEYNTMLSPGKKDDKFYLKTLYDGKSRMFIFNFIKDNKEDFINF